MATVPLSGSNIRILSGVPFSNDYKNTRWFDDVTSQTNYFLGKQVVHSMGEATFQRIEGYNFIRANKSIDELWGANYVMFQNASYNNKWFYAFVTKLEYIQRNVTNVHFAIDVFQTWKFEMNFKPSFVIREHCPLWNEDGTPVINTVDEGLNYGTEYDNVYTVQLQPNGGYKWLVVLAKKLFHDEAPAKVTAGTVIGTPQPLSVYLVPFMDNDTVPSIHMASGLPDLLCTKPSTFLQGLYTTEDAVNNIVSLYITDYTGIPVSGTEGSITFPDNNNLLEQATFSDGTNTFQCIYVREVFDFEAQVYDTGNKYDGYKAVTESKLMMHPYTQLILDDFKGNRITYKNEYIASNDLIVLLKGSLGTSNKTSYSLYDYNNTSGNETFKDYVADENALINSEPNDIPIITDLLAAYMQGNRNSLMNKNDSILFNGILGSVSSVGNASFSAMSGNAQGTLSGGLDIVRGAGNTVLQLQGIEAKLKDISNVPPSISKMGSNTSYTIGNNYNGVFLIKKHIKDEYMKKLTDFFNMFGYKKNEVKLPNFHTRQNWNYVQTSSCTILGNFNNDDLQELKSVFDNGITLWHTDDVGNYALSNGVI